MFLFLDESGDLGFDWSKQGASSHFVITILVCRDMTALKLFQTAVQRTLRNKLNSKTKRKRLVQELKGAATTFTVKEYFFRHLPSDGWELHTIIVNKKRVYDYLQTKQGKKRLYNYLARIVLEKLPFESCDTALNLIVDRCKNSAEIKDFNGYITTQLEARLPLQSKLYITHESSQASAGLQAVDMFCWGIARKYCAADRQWYQLFRTKITKETNYL